VFHKVWCLFCMLDMSFRAKSWLMAIHSCLCPQSWSEFVGFCLSIHVFRTDHKFCNKCFWEELGESPLPWIKSNPTYGLVMLHCWHDTGLRKAFTFSSSDNRFSRCPKQSKWLYQENNFAPVFCSLILVLPVEFQPFSLM